MTQEETRRELKARRALAKLGLRLCKSRVRNPNLDDLGGYRIVDAQQNCVVRGSRSEYDLADVEAYINGEEGGKQ
jgi:hypothetical protein